MSIRLTAPLVRSLLTISLVAGCATFASQTVPTASAAPASRSPRASTTTRSSPGP